MTRKLLIALAGFLAFSAPALAQNAPSNSPRVQGVPAGSGDPVQVTIRSADGTTAGGVGGDVANGVADSGNPVKIGAVDATAMAATTTGQRSNLLSYDGALMTALTTASLGNAPADATAGQIGFVSNNTNFGAAMTLAVTPQVYTGSSLVSTRGDSNGLVVQRGLSSTYWTYSNGATGILSNTTTAVTIKTAAGASVRNYIDSCQINTTAFGTSVPLAIRDGAGGTVIWAMSVPTAGFLQPVTVSFGVPLRSTANTLLEVVTTTANTSGTVWVNCQGHTGS